MRLPDPVPCREPPIPPTHAEPVAEDVHKAIRWAVREILRDGIKAAKAQDRTGIVDAVAEELEESITDFMDYEKADAVDLACLEMEVESILEKLPVDDWPGA